MGLHHSVIPEQYPVEDETAIRGFRIIAEPKVPWSGSAEVGYNMWNVRVLVRQYGRQERERAEHSLIGLRQHPAFAEWDLTLEKVVTITKITRTVETLDRTIYA